MFKNSTFENPRWPTAAVSTPLGKFQRDFEKHYLPFYVIKMRNLLKRNWLQFVFEVKTTTIKQRKSLLFH